MRFWRLTLAALAVAWLALAPAGAQCFLNDSGLSDKGGVLCTGSNQPTVNLNFLSGTLDPRITFTRASTATYYNSAGLLAIASSGAARFTYDPTTLTALGLLIEESRTNLALQSNAFGTTWSLLNVSSAVTAAAGTSPDGSSNAWKTSEADTTSAGHGAAQTITKAASSLQYTLTLFAKPAERARVYLQQASGANGAGQVFDLAGGQIGPTNTFGTGFTINSATIQSVGNGWYRCAVTITGDATTVVQANFQIDSGSGTGARSTTYAGTIGSGVLIYGAQLEQAAFPTSYIPTTTASVTRSADVATMTLASIGIPANPAGLTILFKGVTPTGLTSAKNPTIIALDDGTTSNRFGIRQVGSGGNVVGFMQGGTSPWSPTLYPAAPASTAISGWIGLSSRNSAAQIVGQTKQTDVLMTGLPTGLTMLRIGGAISANDTWNSTIARLQIYNRRLPDAQAAQRAGAM